MEDKIIHLERENKRLKAELAQSMILHKKKDRLEQDYENSQARFKKIFEESPLGNKFINSDLKIIKVNKALLKLLGYSKKELLGTRITDIAHPDFLDHWEKLRRELWTEKRACFSVDTCILKKDRSFMWCHVTSILFVDNGESFGYTIIEDISHRKYLEYDLKEANKRELLFQQQLLEVTIDITEKERSRIAEDLHNSLGQLFFSVKLNLNRIKFENSEQQNKNTLAIKDSQDILSECIKETKRISYDLMPPILEDFGLQEAVKDICNRLKGVINFNCYFNGLQSRLPKHLEIAIYRIIQELTTNVVKHAQATSASLNLGISKNNILIKIEDNGKGFNAIKTEGDQYKIKSIKNKIQLLKGHLEISSTPGKGTMVSIHLPGSYIN